MRKLCCLMALTLLAGGSACLWGGAPEAAWDPLFPFDGGRTYDWAPKEPETGPALPYEEFDRAVKRAVDAHLRAAGFTLSSAAPRFRLTYYVGVEEVGQISDNAYYGPGWGAYWGSGWYGPAGINISQYDGGTVTIDVLSADPAIGLVWRGIAHSEIAPSMSPQSMESAVESAVRKVIQGFPPASDD